MAFRLGLEDKHGCGHLVGVNLGGSLGVGLAFGVIALGIGRLGLVHELLQACLLGLVGLEDSQPLKLDLATLLLVLHLDLEGNFVLLGQLECDFEAADHGPHQIG